MHTSRSSTWLVRIWMLVWLGLLGWFAVDRLTREPGPKPARADADAPAAASAIEQPAPEALVRTDGRTHAIIGRVIALTGAWTIDGAPLAAGVNVPAQARLKPQASTSSNARLTIALFDGRLLTVAGAEGAMLPPAIGTEKPHWRELVTGLPDLSTRLVPAAASEPASPRPRMLAIDAGHVSVASVFYQLPPNRYRLELHPRTVSAAGPIVLRYDASHPTPVAMRLRAPAPGMYQLRLLAEGDMPAQLLEESEVALVPQPGFNRAAAAFSDAQSAVQHWAGENDASVHRAFLREALEVLSASGATFASVDAQR